jgi:phenylalanyl-tRNA synthetase alpha chain
VGGEWMEMLGSGILHRGVLGMAGVDGEEYIGWASGIGLERFAILMYGIPDIRYFWSEDKRFLGQFDKDGVKGGGKFQVYSKYPSCYKDMSFWVADIESFEENDLFEVVRSCGGDLVEKMDCVDKYEDKARGRTSLCYRIYYRSLERTLTNEEIDLIQFKIRDLVTSELRFLLR